MMVERCWRISSSSRGMDRRPDAAPRALRRPADHGCRSAPGLDAALQLGHVLDRDLDRDLHRLAVPGVDDRDLAAGAAEEPGDLLERPLRRREPDPLRLLGGQRRQPLEAEGEVGAALGGGHRVDLVDDDPAHRPEDLAGRAGEHQEERLGGGDEDVGRVALDLAALVLGRVAGADRRR